MKLIEKGTVVFIYNMFDDNSNGHMELVVGEDILTADDYYANYNGIFVVAEEEVEKAVDNYMETRYPWVIEYMYEIGED